MPEICEVADGAPDPEFLARVGCRADFDRLASAPITSTLPGARSGKVVFDRQDPAWRARVLPPGLPRVAVEAGSGDLWRKYVGMEGAVVSLDRFGESGPAPELFRHFGFTAENVARTVKEVQR